MAAFASGPVCCKPTPGKLLTLRMVGMKMAKSGPRAQAIAQMASSASLRSSSAAERQASARRVGKRGRCWKTAQHQSLRTCGPLIQHADDGVDDRGRIAPQLHARQHSPADEEERGGTGEQPQPQSPQHASASSRRSPPHRIDCRAVRRISRGVLLTVGQIRLTRAGSTRCRCSSTAGPSAWRRDIHATVSK